MTIITEVFVTSFRTLSRTFRDSEGHDHPSPSVSEAIGFLLAIGDSDGNIGYSLMAGDSLRPEVVRDYIRPALVGSDPIRRDAIAHNLYLAQRGAYGRLQDRAVAYVECALWDLLGRRTNLPVWKLVGGYRDRVAAYASTMCGDEIPGGLSTPEDYAAFAVDLVARGYRGIKLHTWMPPVSFAPDARADIRACAAVREAVGQGVTLMLDSHHWYSRSDALYIARELEKLDFAWMEEPMDEYSIASYRWLQQRTSVAIAGPESVAGSFRARADWAASGASDLLRIGVGSAGGITAALKTCHLAEAFGMDVEIHGGGAANLAVLAAAPNAHWYEAGLLHPHLDSDSPLPHLTAVVDKIDAEGNVLMPTIAGLGEPINFEYIASETITTI